MIQCSSEEALTLAGFFWFSYEQWSRIEPLLPTGLHGARRIDDPLVLSGIVHAICDGKGCPCVLMIPPENVHDIKVAKAWRRVTTRFDRTIKTFTATNVIAATVIWCLK